MKNWELCNYKMGVLEDIVNVTVVMTLLNTEHLNSKK